MLLREDISRNGDENARVPRRPPGADPRKFAVRVPHTDCVWDHGRRNCPQALVRSAREEAAMKAVQVVKYGDAVEGIELREVP